MSKMEVFKREQESEYSNHGSSPMSGVQESPVSSPSQQVPNLISYANEVLWVGRSPHLYIVEQPMKHFRFRYKSEMVGTHGCILGSRASQKNKTHPTVELRGYSGKAMIHVQLVQAECDEEHPHKLLEEEQDRDITANVPERDSYKVAFAGLGIIHTAKKDVPDWLFKKHMSKSSNPGNTIQELHKYCEGEAKKINLNKVRLRFTAYDLTTHMQICNPVYSEPINNMKSASTNGLKICRMSRSNGRARGGDDVYLLVEKVNKKNIQVRFFQDGEDEVPWSAFATFLPSDVHFQHAIVIRTPPYKDPHISTNVRVKIELVRPSDGIVSEPKEYEYKADPGSWAFHRQNKKRRANSTFSSYSSLSGGSLNSIGDIPVTVTNMTQNIGDQSPSAALYHNMEMPVCTQLSSASDLGDALLYGAGATNFAKPTTLSPMLGQPNVEAPPIVHLNSSEFSRLLENDRDITTEDKQRFSFQSDLLPEYMQIFTSSLNDSLKNDKRLDSNIGNIMMGTMELVADSGGAKEIKEEPMNEEPVTKDPVDDGAAAGSSQPGVCKNITPSERLQGKSDYAAHYKADQGAEVKNLVKEICEIIKNKDGFKRQTVCSKLERLMTIRLSNGDTFLHMTLSSNQPSFEYIVKLIHSMRLQHLLTLTNHLQQTILHVAATHALSAHVQLLVHKGCDPMASDWDGNTVLHLAAIHNCMPALLTAVDSQNTPIDVNVYNNEKQTPLHLAAIYDESESARLLLARGADCCAIDREGRTPLHLACYDDNANVARTLLDRIPQCEIDMVDGRGNTALQIVCVSAMRSNTLTIARMLLEKKADPMRHEQHNACAWQLSRSHAALHAALAPHVPADVRAADLNAADLNAADLYAADLDEVKCEPDDDEYTSADDGESNEGLPSKSLAMHF